VLNCKSIAAVVVVLSGTMSNFAQAGFQPGEFITYSNESWGGDSAVPGSAAQLLLYYFDLAFPNGYVEVGIPGNAGFSMVFSSATSALDYLPASGPPGPLANNTANPTDTSSGIFGGEVLALQLDFAFADAGLLVGSTGIRFEDLVLRDLSRPYLQSFNGSTVRDFFTEASLILGGGTYLDPGDESGFFNLAYELDFAFDGGMPSQFAQNHLRVVPEPAAGALAIIAIMIVPLARRRQTPRGTASGSCRCTRLIVAFNLLIAALSPLASAQGSRFIHGEASAAMTYDGGPIFSNSASDSASLSEGRIVTGSAFQNKGGTASFSIDPSAGAGGVFGQSAQVTFNSFNLTRLGSQVDAYITFKDSFTIDGPIPDNFVVGLIKVNYSGALFPNTDFESQYAANYGNATITASVTFAMTTGWLDEQGDFLFGGHALPPTGLIGEAGHPTFERSAHDEFVFDNEHRTIGVEFTFGGLADMGGGFSFQGRGGVTAQARIADGNLAALSSSLRDSFFEIVIELPPAYSIHGHSVFMRHVTVPEPTTLALIGIGIGCVGVVTHRRTRGNIAIESN
jgi:hypothetical protein